MYKRQMYSHLEMTEEEATLRLQGNYAADIKVFDKIENEALKMANYMFDGIVNRCSCSVSYTHLDVYKRQWYTYSSI